MLVEEDTLSSALNFRLSELAEDNERSDAGSSVPHVTPTRRFIGLLALSVFVTLTVVVGPVVVVAVLVPHHGMLWEVLAVVLAVVGSLAAASVGSRLWMRWPRSREVIFGELMLWNWVRRFRAERRLAHTRDLFESARESGSTVSIELLTKLSDLHQAVDPYLHGHSRRVASYAGRIAREMRLSPREIADIETAALVHDVGKIYTPREILHKPGRLTDREFAIVKLHARDGAEILAGAGDPQLTAIVRHHHERLDGNGYPDRIAAAEIPLGSRIIAVADTFDAITSTRPYRPPRSHKEAIDILSKESGTQLDATVVAAFLACYAARRPVARSALASAVCEQFVSAIKASSTSLTAGSVARTLPALGVAGVLAASPAPQHGGVDHPYEATQTAAPIQTHARLVSGSAPAGGDDAKTVLRTGQLRTGRPLAGRRENPRSRTSLPGTDNTSPNTNTVPGASTSEPGPPSESHGSTQNPAGSGSEPSNPTAPVPVPPSSPPVKAQPPQPTLPVHPAEPPVQVPSTPPVTISVPNTPVQVSAPSVPFPPVNLPVKLPAINVPSVLEGVGLHVGG